MKRLYILTFCLFLTAFSSFPMPKTIIIIRHGDGFYVPAKGEEMGPALSKEGMLRTSVFLKYYLEVLNKEQKIPLPDYIFACNPYYIDAHHKMAQSVRHIQTVSPLVTWMYEHQMNQTPDDLLQIPYIKQEYKKMAHLIAEQEYVNDKTILICWSHEVIHKMIDYMKAFSGYSMESNWPEVDKWKGGEFETVVIIRCDNENKKMSVDRIRGALKIPETKKKKEELGKWFFDQFIQ